MWMFDLYFYCEKTRDKTSEKLKAIWRNNWGLWRTKRAHGCKQGCVFEWGRLERVRDRRTGSERDVGMEVFRVSLWSVSDMGTRSRPNEAWPPLADLTGLRYRQGCWGNREVTGLILVQFLIQKERKSIRGWEEQGTLVKNKDLHLLDKHLRNKTLKWQSRCSGGRRLILKGFKRLCSLMCAGSFLPLWLLRSSWYFNRFKSWILCMGRKS